MRRPRLQRLSIFVKRCAIGLSLTAAAAAADAERLGDLTVEQLLDLKVTSVARRQETVSRSPAAVFVITAEDIHRSGALTIPDALRLAPGLHVAHLDSHTWAISSRGFNDIFANKLLVLIDGRSVYTPLFSGVQWDLQDVVLADIDRIEVIRGPGAALWGANAVNGVINITTKAASQTQGGHLEIGGGNEERAFSSVRFGGSLSDEVHYRVHAKGFLRDDSSRLDGGEANDSWRMGRAGFRLDWTPPANAFTLSGDLYRGFEDAYFQRLRPEPPFAAYSDRSVDQVSGGNLLGRWTRELPKAGELALQVYYDQTNRDSAILREERHIFDVDLQHRFALASWQTVVWGGGYRASWDELQNNFDTSVTPAAMRRDLFNVFVQDEITLIPNRVVLTLGSKLEHNDFTGFELQPSARLLWTPTDRQSAWASISRGARTPSRAESGALLRLGPAFPAGALFPGSPPTIVKVIGNPDFDSEEVTATEFGYRAEITPRLSFDLALFYNEFRGLRSFDGASPLFEFDTSPPSVNLLVGNRLEGETYGGEITATWQVAAWWRLRANYSLLHVNARRTAGGNDVSNELAYERNNPRHQAALRSQMDLPHGFEVDATVRYVDEIPGIRVPAAIGVDLRLGWRATDRIEFSIFGRDLFDRRHTEFKPTTIGTEPTEIERSIYGSVTIRF